MGVLRFKGDMVIVEHDALQSGFVLVYHHCGNLTVFYGWLGINIYAD